MLQKYSQVLLDAKGTLLIWVPVWMIDLLGDKCSEEKAVKDGEKIKLKIFFCCHFS